MRHSVTVLHRHDVCASASLWTSKRLFRRPVQLLQRRINVDKMPKIFRRRQQITRAAKSSEIFKFLRAQRNIRKPFTGNTFHGHQRQESSSNNNSNSSNNNNSSSKVRCQDEVAVLSQLFWPGQVWAKWSGVGTRWVTAIAKRNQLADFSEVKSFKVFFENKITKKCKTTTTITTTVLLLQQQQHRQRNSDVFVNVIFFQTLMTSPALVVKF